MPSPPGSSHDRPTASQTNRARRERGAATRRPWPVTANALLLLLEALLSGLMAAGFLWPLGVTWPITLALWNEHRGAVVLSFVFALLAMLAMAAALGFLRQARGAWLLAVLAQGIDLAVALLLYLESRPAYVYGMMVYGIVMVLYLHQADVQAVFRPDEAHGEAGSPA